MSLPRVRGHRIAGPVITRDRARHWGAETAAAIGFTFAEAAAVAGTAASAAGTAVSVYAAAAQGQRAREADRYNAKVAQSQAAAAQQSAAVQEAAIRERNQRVQASARAALGESGITTEGSPLLVLMDNARQAELEARLTRAEGDRAAAGYQSQSRLLNYYGGQAASAGYLQAGTTLLTGAGSFLRGVKTPSSAPQGYNPINNPYSGPIM